MPFFQGLSNVFSYIKNKVTSVVFFQSLWQGFAAPYADLEARTEMVNRSVRLGNIVEDIWKCNLDYAARIMTLYLFYYRMLSPFLKYLQHDGDEAYVEEDYNLKALDYSAFVAMNVYLTAWSIYTFVQNAAFTGAVVKEAGKCVPALPDDKSVVLSVEKNKLSNANCKDCNKPEKDSGILYGIIANVAVRGVCLGAPYIQSKMKWMPYGLSHMLVMGLESTGLGMLFLDGKLSASGMCLSHRWKELWESHKAYSFAFGLAFLLATKSAYTAARVSIGEEPMFLSDAFSSWPYQYFLLTSFARKKMIPGDNSIIIDFKKWAYLIVNSSAMRTSLNLLLGDLCSLEQLVQTPGVAALLLAYEEEIRGVTSKTRGNMERLQRIQNSWFVQAAKKIGSIMPFQVISPSIKDASKAVSKTTVINKTLEIEKYLDLAIASEKRRHSNVNVVLHPSAVSLEQLIKEVREDTFEAPKPSSTAIIEKDLSPKDAKAELAAPFVLMENHVEAGSPKHEKQLFFPVKKPKSAVSKAKSALWKGAKILSSMAYR